MRWVAADNAGVEDSAVWDALRSLAMVDAGHGHDQPYLFPDDQVKGWRRDLLAAP
jgi:hypothetical protein